MQNKNDNRREVRKMDLASVVYGKIPPQATDLEEAVLGALLIDKDAMQDVAPIISAESFYDDRHKNIYTAIHRLYDRDMNIDLLTVTEELRKMGQLEESGGPFYVTQLTNRVASAAHVEEHARIVEQKNIQRKIIRIGTLAVHDAYEDTDDVFELMERLEQDFAEINGTLVSNEIYHISEVGKQVKKEFADRAERNASPGIPVGYKEIDDDLGEMQKGDLVIWAGRASMGKTAMMVCAAINQASQGITVGIISMEMTRAQLFNRLICHQTGIPVKRLNRNDIHADEVEKKDAAERYINSLPIFIEDSSNPSIAQFKTRCMRMKRKYGVEIIYGDHLGKMMIPKETNDYIITSTAVKTCKAIAKTLDIPVVMLSQLSRKTEQMKDMKPMLSHLRDSGKIEEEADVVVLFYRPEYYDRQGIKGFDTLLVHGRKVSSKGFCEANYVKNRNGEVKPVYLTFIGESMKFITYDESYYSRIQDSARIKIEQEKKIKEKEGLFHGTGALDGTKPPDDDLPF